MNPAWVFYVILNFAVLGRVESPSLEACNQLRDWTWQAWNHDRGEYRCPDVRPFKEANLRLTPCRWTGEP